MTHSPAQQGDSRGVVMRRRILFGLSLAGGIIVLLAIDAWLAARLPEVGDRPEEYLGYWLSNGLVVTALLSTLALLLTNELIDLAHRHGYRPLRFETYLFAGGLVVGPYISFNVRETAAIHDEAWGMVWLSLALGYAFWAQAVRRGTDHVMRNIATTMFIIFYAGGLVGYMTKLRMEIGGAEGVLLLLFSMFIVKITDTGAYFVGSFLGRNKFLPWLSPKKTWEGIVGGILTATATAVLGGLWLAHSGLCPGAAATLEAVWAMALFGFVMSWLSIGGDLAGSLLKRDAALSDSSKLIPGLGGVLDILDSPLITAPAAWLFWTRLAPLISG